MSKKGVSLVIGHCHEILELFWMYLCVISPKHSKLHYIIIHLLVYAPTQDWEIHR
jgi:hypothetical protein